MTEGSEDSKAVHFRLSKWYLDFFGENGDAMIFYSAKLTRYGLSASYTSWLHYTRESGVKLESRFTLVQIPRRKGKLVTWSDLKFGISGTWESAAPMIHSRIYDSEEGSLDWDCFQPASHVRLTIGDRVMEGNGYAEHLMLTALPWKIPMDELRWGHFLSKGNNMVWIELREKEKLQWLWWNGEKIGNFTIGDDKIWLPEKKLTLNLDRGVNLESEKKIFSVATKIVRYIPGFKKIIPVGFLMADEFKWLSKGEIQAEGGTLDTGMAIHELVDFKSHGA